MLYRVTDTVHVYPIYRVEVEAGTPIIAAKLAVEAMMGCVIGDVDKKVVNEILEGLIVVELPGSGELISGKLAAGTPVEFDVDKCHPRPLHIPLLCYCGEGDCAPGMLMCPECIARDEENEG